MLGSFLTALAAALVCTVILWIIREMMICPVKSGRNTKQCILLEIKGREPALENHLTGLLWLAENKILKCNIIIHGLELDEETRQIIKTFEAKNESISFNENGEIPQWIRNSSF